MSIEFADRSYLYGDALFETLRVLNGVPDFLEDHIARFKHSAEFFAFSGVQMNAGVEALRGLHGAEDGLWRVTVSRDCERYPMAGTSSVQLHRRECPQRRPLTLRSEHGFYHPGDCIAEHKTTSYLRYVEARRRAKLAGADDALLVSSDGFVGETSVANIFAVVNHVLITPAISGVLPGVIRARVIHEARKRQLQVLEQKVTYGQLKAADEIFVTSSGAGVSPVLEMDGTRFPVKLADAIQEWIFGDE